MHPMYNEKEHDVLYFKIYIRVMPFSKWLLSAIDCVHMSLTIIVYKYVFNNYSFWNQHMWFFVYY
jgi:hypothetical protein